MPIIDFHDHYYPPEYIKAIEQGPSAVRITHDAEGNPLLDHYYPPEYIKAIEQGPSAVRITHDAEGNPLLHYPGDYNVAVRGHRDIDYREQVLREKGIDTQVITLTTPGTHIEEPSTAVRLARLVNDVFARVVADKKGRFAALATLPLCDPAASVAELRRAMEQLRLPGAMLFSNVNGVALSDQRFWPLYEVADDALATLPLRDPAASVAELRRAMEQLRLPGAMLFSNVNGVALSDQRFWPLYEVADELGAVLHIHPTNPVGVEAMLDYWLMPLVGFLFDTTLAAAGLVFSGLTERFPRIRWVLSHLGGAIPYLAERLDRGYEAFAECRKHVQQLPSSYLKRFYYDTVNFDPRALELAVTFAGADQILAGSDYPHQIGSIDKMLESLKAIRVSEDDREKILGGNARKLLGL